MSLETKCNDTILKFDLGEPSEYAKEKAIRELRETPENIENSLKELKELLKDEPTLSVPQDNDAWLLTFLLVCKYYPKSAVDLMKRLFTLRLEHPNITEKLLPSKLKLVFDTNVVTIAPNRDQFGRRIICSMAGTNWNTQIVNKFEVTSATILCSHAVQFEPETLINGVVYIIDLKGLTFSKVLEFTPSYIKLQVDYLQGNFPLRMKGFHVVNQPSIFTPVFNLAKKLFMPKYAHRILMHGSNYKSLHQHISPECLPECYGGTLKTDWSNSRETYELLSHYAKDFEIQQKYGFKKT